MSAAEASPNGSLFDGASPAESRAPEIPEENREIAVCLEEIATLLTHQGASEFRIRAYHSAGEMLQQFPLSVQDILEQEGVEGLVALPTIGHSIAHLIEQYLRSGRIGLLNRLRGDEGAERVFESLPGVGRELAHRIHDQLEIETLPELMAAVADGRLQKVPGLGRKRLRAIRESLMIRLRHPDGALPESPPLPPPETAFVPVDELLDIDREYRDLANRGKLPKIAPRRFNPDSVAWLPILHTHRRDRHYTALYSNTARAHQLNTTKDRVVIYRDDPQSNGRWTVITSQFGKLRGWRIVRGREAECEEYYLHHQPEKESTR